MAVTAILANQRTPLAIAEWAARQGATLRATLGFVEWRTPCQSALHRAFAAPCGDRLSAAPGAYFPKAAPPAPAAQGAHGVAIDGKAQRGRLRSRAGGSPVHALTAFCHEQGVVLAHEPIGGGADKAEAGCPLGA